ncbi:hypothetical protein [Streptomyces sp. Ag109_G2-15]|uniref:hypothetical protein n=1 Tax=Streptomyces sp. Ag109_G2-15 TaxID=1938850 RepID=UPI000BE324ED|nr:hypothetical protein [Streptomyces sp. Ag109_G2-15]
MATGQAVASVSGGIADFYPWPNLAFIPILDAPPSRWAPVWRTAAETPHVRSFTRAPSDAPPAVGEDCWCALPASASEA